jgi:Zn ribbon nucleic-acid-binding protein
MKKNLSLIIVLVVVIAAVGAVVWAAVQPGKLDGFTQCLKEEGAIFYGAFWCPACQQQKQMFGKSQRQIPYVECSTPDSQRQTQVCVDAEIQSYPTWEFGDGERVVGMMSIRDLAERTGCLLPDEE